MPIIENVLIRWLRLAAVLAIVAAPIAHTKHFTCSWTPIQGDSTPEQQGWHKWCKATIGAQNIYKCDPREPYGEWAQVADYDWLGDHVLELCESQSHVHSCSKQK